MVLVPPMTDSKPNTEEQMIENIARIINPAAYSRNVLRVEHEQRIARDKAVQIISIVRRART